VRWKPTATQKAIALGDTPVRRCPQGGRVKLVVTTLGMLVVLAWAFHELVFLHEQSEALDT